MTGGANGIGCCITEHFASEGDTVYILDKEAKQTVLVANEMQHKGWNVIGYIGDIARAVAFLCDERNSFINGENITIDGGMSKLMIYQNDCGWEYKAPIVKHP
ncbi:SDR family oxidoreductase [Bacteroides acidifaciens]|nr:SDR family oxidoreductase [Bacteroides acidifaciens]